MATDKDFVVKNGLQVGANTSIVGAITTVDSIQFDLTANTDPYAEGQLAWNADHGTLTLGIDGSDVDLHIGEDTVLKVKAAATITKGDVVYASGAVGNSGNIEVTPFMANATIEAKRVIGIAAQNIATGAFGYVISEGEIRGIDASGGLTTGAQTWSDGDILYASPDYAGELTNVEPTAPNQDIAIAFVVSNNGSNGIIQVRASQLGYNLSELHDVNISSVANNQILVYDAVNTRWNNSDDLNLPGSLTVAGDLTVNGTTTTINSTTLTVDDLNIVVASDVANSSLAEGAGIIIAPDSANVVLAYNATDDALDLNNTLIFSAGRDAYLSNTLPGIYRAFSTTGTYPFNRYGDLVIQARSSHARDIVFVTGTTPANRMVISENGNVGIGSELDHSTQPTAPLHLYDSSATSLRIQGSNKNLYLSANTTGTFISHNQYVPLNISTHDSTIVLSTDDGSTAALTVNTNDSVTIPTLNSTTVNATTLNGAFGNTQVEVASSYPVTPATGNIWFDNLNLKLKVFDGTNWQDAVPSGGGGSANSASTDANATFAKYTYTISSATSVVSGSDVNSNTLSYDTSGIENVEVYVNGVKQVEGASYDYTATTGTSIGFTTTLSAGDVVDIQVYELLTNDAFVLKAGGAFEGSVEFQTDMSFTKDTLAHGMTLIAPTDTWGEITRNPVDSGVGGMRISAFSDNATPFNLSAYAGVTSNSQDKAVIRLRGAKANGTSEQPLANTEILYTLGNTGTEVHVVRGDGHTTFNGNGGSGAQLVFDQWGTIAQSYNSNQVASFSWTGTGASNIQQYATGVLKNRFNAAGDNYITGGNVGIGHDSPSNALHIKATNTSGRGQVTIEGSADGVDPRMSFYGFDTNAGTASSTYVLDIFGDTSEKGARYDVPSGYYQAFTEQGTKRLRIAPGGNLLFERNGIVGRNTSDGSDNGYIAVVGGGAESDGRGAIARFYGNEHSTETGNLALSSGNVSGSVIALRAAGTNVAYVGSGGLGLGTDTPTSYGSGVPTIHFQGTTTNDRAGAIRFHENDGTQTGALYSTNGDDGYGGIILHAAQGATKFPVGTLQDTKMSINTTGYVAIGKGNTFADNRLEVVHTGTDATVRIENTSGQANEGACLVLDASGRGTGVVDIDIFKIENNNGDLFGINNAGDLIPYTSTQDLGSTANPWQNIYTQDLVLSNESRETGNDIDGTKGNWTVQEGEDHLYLINNKNGKKYRFALEEIE